MEVVAEYESSHSDDEDAGDDVQLEVLDARQLVEAARRKRFKSAVPDKEDDLEHDLGALATLDTNPIDVEAFRRAPEQLLNELARDNAQLLLNRVFKQPAVKTADGVFAELPPPSTVLPREKPLPKPKPKTKWDQFAQQKGIMKRKKGTKEWDEGSGDWTPRYGYGSAKNDKMADWLVELPDTGTGFEDPRAEQKTSKKKAMRKNEKQKLANRARASAKGMRKMPGSESIALITGGTTLDRKRLKSTIKAQMAVTKKGTASAGKFAKTLEGEPKLKKDKQTRAPNSWSQQEKETQHKVLDRVLQKEAKSALDVNKAVNRHLEEQKRTTKSGQEAAGKQGKKRKGRK